MEFLSIKRAHDAYLKSAENIFQLSTRIWISETEEIVQLRTTIATNVHTMINVRQMVPPLHRSQVQKPNIPYRYF